MPSTTPKTLDISKSSGIQVTWADGHQSSYDLTYLRDNCPCATCTNAHGTSPQQSGTSSANPFVMYKQRPKIVDAEVVGRYAIRILWSDGHNTGIYSYVHLREICPCAECAAARTSTAGENH